jgi:hypothetical protein
VPALVGTSQASHWPSQVLSQQNPSTQLALWHWFSWSQVSPFSRFSAHVPARVQKADGAQSESSAQAVAQASPAHTKGAQLVALSTQVPAPSHRLPVTLVSVQLVVPQGVLAMAKVRQAPTPLQTPGAPQASPDAGHSSSGSVPGATGSQMPSAPTPFLAAEQASQAPEQEPSQQTPSAQKLLWQWPATEQGAPMGRSGTQRPSSQWCEPVQSTSLVQEVRHPKPIQAKPSSQARTPASTQVPAPSHSSGTASVAGPAHRARPHTVPAS